MKVWDCNQRSSVDFTVPLQQQALDRATPNHQLVLQSPASTAITS
jgi:hypothetical protein